MQRHGLIRSRWIFNSEIYLNMSKKFNAIHGFNGRGETFSHSLRKNSHMSPHNLPPGLTIQL